MDCNKIGFVWCEDHGIYHEVFQISEEHGVDMVSCGNCLYDITSWPYEFLIYGQKPPFTNDRVLEHLNEVEATHG